MIQGSIGYVIHDILKPGRAEKGCIVIQPANGLDVIFFPADMRLEEVQELIPSFCIDLLFKTAGETAYDGRPVFLKFP